LGGNGGNAGNPGGSGTTSTSNCQTVTPGGSYPVSIGSGGTATISWNPQ
jgi:hypothetical protein